MFHAKPAFKGHLWEPFASDINLFHSPQGFRREKWLTSACCKRPRHDSLRLERGRSLDLLPSRTDPDEPN